MKQMFTAVGLVSLLLGGCASRELTRDRARTIIESSEAYKPAKRQITIQRFEADDLVKEGYLAWRGFAVYQLTLTDKGNNTLTVRLAKH